MLTTRIMLWNHIALIILFGVCSAAEEEYPKNNVFEKKLLFKDGKYPHLLNYHSGLSIHHPFQESNHVKGLLNIDLIKQNSKEGHRWPNTLSSVSTSRRYKNYIHNENQFYDTSKKIKRSASETEEESKQVLFNQHKPLLEENYSNYDVKKEDRGSVSKDDDLKEKDRGSLFKDDDLNKKDRGSLPKDDDDNKKGRGSLFKPVFHCVLLLCTIIIFI